MNCPECNASNVKYTTQRNIKIHKNEKLNDIKRRRKSGGNKRIKADPRTDFNASCSTCGWKGEIR